MFVNLGLCLRSDLYGQQLRSSIGECGEETEMGEHGGIGKEQSMGHLVDRN